MNLIESSRHHYVLKRRKESIIFIYQRMKLHADTYLWFVLFSYVSCICIFFTNLAMQGIFFRLIEYDYETIFELMAYALVIALFILFISIIMATLAFGLVNLSKVTPSFRLCLQGIVIQKRHYLYRTIHGIYVKSPQGRTSELIPINSLTDKLLENEHLRASKLQSAGTMTYQLSRQEKARAIIADSQKISILSSFYNTNYKLCLLYEGKEQVLANGLTVQQAFELLGGVKALLR
jgi:hypothetical protein